MKKILALLVIILLVYFGYQVYLRNTEPKEESNIDENIQEDYELDENYALSMYFEENGVSYLTIKTYYIYDNKRAILETIVHKRNDNSLVSHTYKEVEINDNSFDINKAIREIEKETDVSSSAYRFIFRTGPNGSEYKLPKTSNITKKLLKMFGEEAK